MCWVGFWWVMVGGLLVVYVLKDRGEVLLNYLLFVVEYGEYCNKGCNCGLGVG